MACIRYYLAVDRLDTQSTRAVSYQFTACDKTPEAYSVR